MAEALRAGKLVPAQHDWAIAYCQADAKGFEHFIARQPAVALGEIDFAGEPQHSMSRVGRSGDAGVYEGGANALTPAEVAVCSQLAIRAEDYLKRRAVRGDYLGLNHV